MGFVIFMAVVFIWFLELILIAVITEKKAQRYMLVEQKNIRYFDTWPEVVFFVKNAQQVDNFYEFQVFVKDKNVYLYLCNSIL